MIVQSPALWALMTCCVRPPSRGPSVFGLRISSFVPKRSTSVGELDLLDVELVAEDVEVRAHELGVGVATTALASGSRTRRPSALRSDSSVEQASRT